MRCPIRAASTRTWASRIMDAGFRVDFTPLYWTYATGFPKAANIAKSAMKRLGDPGEVVGSETVDAGITSGSMHAGRATRLVKREIRIPAHPRAWALAGSYGGFQPKPAVEIVLVAMKPLSERTFVEQALKNRKGVTWLDDARIPVASDEAVPRLNRPYLRKNGRSFGGAADRRLGTVSGFESSGRFPANLLVSNGALNGCSKYFSLDAWAETLPFLRVPKAGQKEKHAGLRTGENAHPTVKPVQLFSYLITLGSREGDVVLDPFVGSGTTCVAAAMLDRKYIGIERERGYVKLANGRLTKGTGGFKVS